MKNKSELLLKIVASCLLVILFILNYRKAIGTLTFVLLVAFVLVSFWILLDRIQRR